MKELEEKFFKTFEIKPKKFSFCGINCCVNQHKSNCTKEKCPFYVKDKIRYPQITDRNYLELINILLNFEYIGLKKSSKEYSIDFQGWLEQRADTLQQCVLQSLCYIACSEWRDVIYKDVQELFKEC